VKAWNIFLNVVIVAGVICGVTACDDDGTYVNAACIDTVSNIKLDNSACSPDYGAPIGSHSWAYHSYRYDEPEIPVYYIGSPVERNYYVYQRPARVNVTHISAPQMTRPAGAPLGLTHVSEPSQSFLTDKRMDKVRAAKPELVERAKNPNIQRGGFGNPAAKVATAPAPNRSLNSPAPGRAPVTATKAPATGPKPTPAYRPPTPPTKIGK
jgi:hypothetical protein